MVEGMDITDRQCTRTARAVHLIEGVAWEGGLHPLQ
jgi:hypothetical protein